MKFNQFLRKNFIFKSVISIFLTVGLICPSSVLAASTSNSSSNSQPLAPTNFQAFTMDIGEGATPAVVQYSLTLKKGTGTDEVPMGQPDIEYFINTKNPLDNNPKTREPSAVICVTCGNCGATGSKNINNIIKGVVNRLGNSPSKTKLQTEAHKFETSFPELSNNYKDYYTNYVNLYNNITKAKTTEEIAESLGKAVKFVAGYVKNTCCKRCDSPVPVQDCRQAGKDATKLTTKISNAIKNYKKATTDLQTAQTSATTCVQTKDMPEASLSSNSSPTPAQVCKATIGGACKSFDQWLQAVDDPSSNIWTFNCDTKVKDVADALKAYYEALKSPASNNDDSDDTNNSDSSSSSDTTSTQGLIDAINSVLDDGIKDTLKGIIIKAANNEDDAIITKIATSNNSVTSVYSNLKSSLPGLLSDSFDAEQLANLLSRENLTPQSIATLTSIDNLSSSKQRKLYSAYKNVQKLFDPLRDGYLKDLEKNYQSGPANDSSSNSSSTKTCKETYTQNGTKPKAFKNRNFAFVDQKIFYDWDSDANNGKGAFKTYPFKQLVVANSKGQPIDKDGNVITKKTKNPQYQSVNMNDLLYTACLLLNIINDRATFKMNRCNHIWGSDWEQEAQKLKGQMKQSTQATTQLAQSIWGYVSGAIGTLVGFFFLGFMVFQHKQQGAQQARQEEQDRLARETGFDDPRTAKLAEAEGFTKDNFGDSLRAKDAYTKFQDVSKDYDFRSSLTSDQQSTLDKNNARIKEIDGQLKDIKSPISRTESKLNKEKEKLQAENKSINDSVQKDTGKNFKEFQDAGGTDTFENPKDWDSYRDLKAKGYDFGDSPEDIKANFESYKELTEGGRKFSSDSWNRAREHSKFVTEKTETIKNTLTEDFFDQFPDLSSDQLKSAFKNIPEDVRGTVTQAVKVEGETYFRDPLDPGKLFDSEGNEVDDETRESVNDAIKEGTAETSDIPDVDVGEDV